MADDEMGIALGDVLHVGPAKQVVLLFADMVERVNRRARGVDVAIGYTPEIRDAERAFEVVGDAYVAGKVAWSEVKHAVDTVERLWLVQLEEDPFA